jgi:hypothetical protein
VRFTVTRQDTSLQYTGDTVLANGGSANVSAVLKENAAPGTRPIAGRTVHFVLGGTQSCDAVTNGTGIAACTISAVNQPLGPGTVTATFAGDTFYEPSSASATTVLFGVLPGGGSFVIGDQNASVGNAVTFWGAQWSSRNSLSGGAAPASFKGFAHDTPNQLPRCGDRWTTGPGNSSKPPGSVPGYMAVIASSAISGSGSSISGNTTKVVVVRTNPGYAGNPGHAGTGTVIAEVCRN